jgi:hypothetical protein
MTFASMLRVPCSNSTTAMAYDSVCHDLRSVILGKEVECADEAQNMISSHWSQISSKRRMYTLPSCPLTLT